MDIDEIASLLRTASDQGLYYQEKQKEIAERFAGSFLFLQDQEVIWHGPDPYKAGPVQNVAGQKKGHAVWLKMAEPQETEGEHFEVYQDTLARFGDLRS